jgi:hypothetical protein
MDLETIVPLAGTRDWLESAGWFTPSDLAWARQDPPPEHYEAFLGDKYDWYGGYGFHVNPRAIFEVGVAGGYSAASLLHGAVLKWAGVRPECTDESVVLVDNNQKCGAALEAVAERIRQEWPFIPTVKFYLLDSQTEWKKIPREEFDIVHIDADHTHRACLNDLRHFGPMVSERGIIVVDDAKDPAVEGACRIFQAEQGMKSRFIDNANGHIILAR